MPGMCYAGVCVGFCATDIINISFAGDTHISIDAPKDLVKTSALPCPLGLLLFCSLIQHVFILCELIPRYYV
jgi:hypothetical protein